MGFKILVVYIAIYIGSIIIGWLTINPFIVWLAKKYFPTKHWDRFLPRIVGALEQVVYTSAFLLGMKEVIGAWLLLKLAGEWNQSDRQQSYPMYNIFLVGNSLSLILGIGTGIFIQTITPYVI